MIANVSQDFDTTADITAAITPLFGKTPPG
jgi:hypothetical protein